MCCFHLHFSYINVLFFQKKIKKNVLQFTFEKNNLQKEKKITSHAEKSQPPWMSKDPSLIATAVLGM